MNSTEILKFFAKQELPQDNFVANQFTIAQAMVNGGIQSLIKTEHHKVYELIMRNSKFTGNHLFHMVRYSPRSAIIVQDVLAKFYEEEFDMYLYIISLLLKANTFLSTIILNEEVDTFLIKRFMTDPLVGHTHKEIVIESVLNMEKPLKYLASVNLPLVFLTVVKHMVSLGCGPMSIFSLDCYENLDSIFSQDFFDSIMKNRNDFIKTNRGIFESIIYADKSMNTLSDIAHGITSFKEVNYVDGSITRTYKSHYLQGVIDEIRETRKRMMADKSSIDFSLLSYSESLYVFDYIVMVDILTNGATNTSPELLFIMPDYDLDSIKLILEFEKNSVLDLYEFWDKEDTSKVQDNTINDVDVNLNEFFSLVG